MSYTADAYDATAPASTVSAGNMYAELQAIKQRLNNQVGGNSVLNLGGRLTTAETSLVDPATGLSALNQSVTLLKTTQLQIQGNVASLTASHTALSNTVSTQGATIAGLSSGMSSITASQSTLSQQQQITATQLTALTQTVTQLGTSLQLLQARVAVLEARP